MRKIIDRSRAKANGARTRGPTIKLFQTTKGAPVKFRQEWLDEFIAEHTVDPRPAREPEYVPEDSFGLDAELFEL